MKPLFTLAIFLCLTGCAYLSEERPEIQECLKETIPPAMDGSTRTKTRRECHEQIDGLPEHELGCKSYGTCLDTYSPPSVLP